MSELVVDFITSLDGYGAAEGWPGWWGVQGPEYLAWLQKRPERDYPILMGANTYRLMYGFASGPEASAEAEENASIAELTAAPKVVFSSTLEAPLPWANTRLINGDAVEAVAEMKREGTSLTTLGSVSLCRSLMKANLVDRFRVVVFPVVTGSTGTDRIYDEYPDVSLEMVAGRTFDRQNPVARIRAYGTDRAAKRRLVARRATCNGHSPLAEAEHYREIVRLRARIGEFGPVLQGARN